MASCGAVERHGSSQHLVDFFFFYGKSSAKVHNGTSKFSVIVVGLACKIHTFYSLSWTHRTCAILATHVMC